jgi:hypothetical protein
MIRVVDNKKLDMTEDEWMLYQKIVHSYTTLSNKGEDYFIDLFETNEEGIIIFLKPPSRRQTSLEVFLFLMSLMQHQHLRLMHQQIDEVVTELKKKKPEAVAEAKKKTLAK